MIMREKLVGRGKLLTRSKTGGARSKLAFSWRWWGSCGRKATGWNSHPIERMRAFNQSPAVIGLKRLGLGIGLITLLSVVLLISDMGNRQTSSSLNSSAGTPLANRGRKFKAAIVYYAPSESIELCIQGLMNGLKDSGFEEGKNLEITRADAQGDMINVPAILQNADNSDVDLIMTATTPCLAGACNTVKRKPVVFTCVSDPIAAGAGKSHRDHLPFVTGVGSFPPVAHMLDLMQKLIPGLRAVGVMYNPAEANSAKEMTVAREVYHQRGVRLEEVALAGSNELLQAVQVLAGRGVQVLWVPADNTCVEGYEGAVKGAGDAKLPLFSDLCSTLPRGGLACLGIGLEAAGEASGKLAARVLHGANPKDLPIEEVAVEQLGISRSTAARLNIAIPLEYSKDLLP